MTKTSISSGLAVDKIAVAIQKVDFDMGLKLASSSMIQEHINRTEDRQLMKQLVNKMGDNDFFK